MKPTELTCLRCGHSWVPRMHDVRICPSCKSARWDELENIDQEPSDPPMEPLVGSAAWFESGPNPIRKDQDLALLIVRIGMAGNALSAQLNAGADAGRRHGAVKMRDLLSSFVTAAAVTNEALQLAREGMAALRPLALHAGASGELLARLGKLCAGKHPASDVLSRARNKVGFHWDEQVVRRSLREYGRNKKIVWLESDAGFQPVHRLAVEVLAHALFPESGDAVADPDEAQRALVQAMSQVHDAMRLIIEFFIASVYGYMQRINAIRREGPKAAKGKR